MLLLLLVDKEELEMKIEKEVSVGYSDSVLSTASISAAINDMSRWYDCFQWSR